MKNLLSLLATCVLLVSCGGGSGGSSSKPASYSEKSLGTFTIPKSPDVNIFKDTGRSANQANWKVSGQIEFKDFFRCVPDGHVGLMAHADLDLLYKAQYIGHGVIFGRIGNGSWTTRNLPQRPIGVLETWAKAGSEPAGFESIFVESVTPFELKDATYNFTFTSSGSKFGYSISDENNTQVYSVEVTDRNIHLDATNQNAVFFDATQASAPVCPYSVTLKNITSVWY